LTMTLDQQARGAHKFVGPALALILLSFPVVLLVPLLKTRVAFVLRDEITLARIAVELYSSDKFLFFVVFFFGIVTPAFKMTMSLAVWYVVDVSRSDVWMRRLNFLSKLSMLDIMLFAIFIVAIKGIGLGRVELRYGFYLYSGLVLSSFALSLVMTGFVEKHRKDG
jgi:paraquat-inducible protein A